jgi:hypothetical protein
LKINNFYFQSQFSCLINYRGKFGGEFERYYLKTSAPHLIGAHGYSIIE